MNPVLAKAQISSCEVAQHPDPRVRRTRRLLEDAFRALVQSKSFSAISVQDITSFAAVNRATFYAHYKDKDHLAASVLKQDLRTAIISRWEGPPPFSPETLTEMAVQFFEFMALIHGTCPKHTKELPDSVGNILRGELFRLLSHWLRQEHVPTRYFPGADQEVVATVISWSLYGSATHWLQSTPRKAASETCRAVVGVLLYPPTGETVIR